MICAYLNPVSYKYDTVKEQNLSPRSAFHTSVVDAMCGFCCRMLVWYSCNSALIARSSLLILSADVVLIRKFALIIKIWNPICLKPLTGTKSIHTHRAKGLLCRFCSIDFSLNFLDALPMVKLPLTIFMLFSEGLLVSSLNGNLMLTDEFFHFICE